MRRAVPVNSSTGEVHYTPAYHYYNYTDEQVDDYDTFTFTATDNEVLL